MINNVIYGKKVPDERENSDWFPERSEFCANLRELLFQNIVQKKQFVVKEGILFRSYLMDKLSLTFRIATYYLFPEIKLLK